MELKMFNGINVIVYGIIIIILAAIMINKFIKNIDKKNKNLMQLYLEIKFLHKNINNLVNKINTNKLTHNLTESIKDYYNLEEIFIFNPITMKSQSNIPKILEKKVNSFIQKNLLDISRTLKDKGHLANKVKFDNNEYVLYIFEFLPNQDNIVICIEDSPVILNKYELLGLTVNISLLQMTSFQKNLV